MSEKQQEVLTEFATIAVPIGLGLLGVAVLWGAFSTRLTQAESNISALEATEQQTATALNAIQVQVGEINTSVTFIEKQYQH